MKQVLLLASALALSTTSPALAACPSSQYNLNGTTHQTSAPSGLDSRKYGCTFQDPSCAHVSIAFDIPAATLSASADLCGDGGVFASVSMIDDFTLVSIPPGTPVHLVVHLALSGGGSNAMSGASGSILDGSGGHADGSPPSTLALGEDVIAGQPFRLTFFGQAVAQTFSGCENANLTGAFSFSGIPAGAAVVSCNGYVSDPAVAARPVSWGRLRTRYR